MVAKAILFAVLAVLAGAIPVPVSNEPRFLLDNVSCLVLFWNKAENGQTVVDLDGQLKHGSGLLATTTVSRDLR